ncbi:hypothetical protein [Vibrio sp. LaRot3]|uniref:hypothetical protein n=1 Tax=Vibrio sp. LaRot3 TaxID=2998829 RepID=UPI0022CDDF48|nr:hypothetical protein [Vibrio sp. LaRot3]MDA0149058.1 hypothetical protein [Vibrio sp. LaRot3]
MKKLFSLLLAALALMLGFYANDIYVAMKPSSGSEVQYCPLTSQACVQDDITITSNRDIVQPLVPFTISAQWPNSQATTLNLTLDGVEMDMGTVKYQLKPTADHHYQAEILLPACTTTAMTWQGYVTDGQGYVYISLRMAL